MSKTRGKTQDLEANKQGSGSEAAVDKTELESKQSFFQSALKKLAYYDKSTMTVLTDGKQGNVNRQRKLLGSKIDEGLDLIQEIQGIFIDLDESQDVYSCVCYRILSFTNLGASQRET